MSVKLFMNLHPDELASPAGVCERLVALQPWAHRVVLEITERSRLQGIEAWEDSVDAVTKMGFSIAVDDLGAGYSSLSVLAELQPRHIKVDMSIVRGIDSEPRKQRLVALLCRFADATGANLIAEGVETQEEAAALRICGAHMLQGYLFGRPSLSLPPGFAEAM
jgi:EAL domain-containing protein (putative c-di-GMP-specific phosphodiesterase class I)